VDLTPELQDATSLKASLVTMLKQRFAKGGRYVIGMETETTPHEHCRQINAGDALLSNPNVSPYARLVGNKAAVLLECTYPFPNLKADPRQGWVIVVAATSPNLADRVVGACLEVTRAAKLCVDRLLSDTDDDAPYGSNDFIFPITGFVREPCSHGGPEGLIGFRHGVTTQYSKGTDTRLKETYCILENTPIETQRGMGLNSGSYEVFSVGRIAAVHRDSREAQAEGRFGANPTMGQNPDDFQAYVRDNEISAVETGYDRLMVIKAAQKMRMATPKAH
jgi:hypothetical protein